MNFNDHSKLKGKHSLLNPSGYNWINYEDDDYEKLRARYYARYAQEVGTAIHELAEFMIKRRMRINKHEKKLIVLFMALKGIPPKAYDLDFIFENLMHYVNDAISSHMEPEVILYYSDYCYGTADTLSFDGETLKIHDLKTGRTPAHFEQLYIYAALFCLEYSLKPSDIHIELAIYQFDKMSVIEPDVTDIAPIMDKIVTFSKFYENLKEE